MEQIPLYDIGEVCRLLGTTSRTLRFWEEKGIITSSVEGNSSRRRYTAEQIALIKRVLVLRALGLSLKVIAGLQAEETDLKNAVLARRAELYASIESRRREIDLLSEALFSIESGKSIFSEALWQEKEPDTEALRIAEIVTAAVLKGDDGILYEYTTPRLAEYMPMEAYRAIRRDTLEPLGHFVSLDRIYADKRYPNTIYSKVSFSKLGLKITFVFYGGKINGLWLGYYETKEGDEI